MARLAALLFLGFVVLGLVGWASNAHALFDVLRFASIVCLMTSLGLFLVLYVRTPDVPGGDRP
jgi:hypothetical protein